MFAQDAAQREKLQHLASKEGRSEYRKFVEDSGRSTYDLLVQEFPSVRIPFEHLLNVVSHLQPRYYTISSSSSVNPKSIHVTVALTKAHLPTGKIHHGVCSTYLSALKPGQQIRAFVRASSFRLPESSKPIILVGPGTGIAPMRALLYERQHASKVRGEKVGPSVLFFGCKKRDHDYLYKEELEKFHKDKVITDLHLAFSREQKEKVYVQHLIVKKGVATKVWELIHKEEAHIYVCGGVLMGHDVHKAFTDLAKGEGKMESQAAIDYVKGLQQAGRYVQELWSA